MMRCHHNPKLKVCCPSSSNELARNQNFHKLLNNIPFQEGA